MAHAKPSCPVCGKPAQTRFRPFCSARCAEVDLGRWFTGQYRIPGRDDDADAEGLSREPPD
jgi:endogenous inhibitor of DNA gyrase (YacG/DUF329 family)